MGFVWYECCDSMVRLFYSKRGESRERLRRVEGGEEGVDVNGGREWM
jgi:hypothetical protein